MQMLVEMMQKDVRDHAPIHDDVREKEDRQEVEPPDDFVFPERAAALLSESAGSWRVRKEVSQPVVHCGSAQTMIKKASD